MGYLILLFGSASTAVTIWLAVKIANSPQRFRPTRRRCIALALLVPAMYLLSFGPACWLNERTSRQVGNGFNEGRGYAFIFWTYRPILHWASQRPTGSEIVYWYAALVTRDAELGIQYTPQPNGGWTLSSFR
jgi:hypothetical protein